MELIGVPEENWSYLQRRLYGLMSEISEDCYSAGWMDGNEYTIWDAMQNQTHLKYGRGMIDESDLADLKALSEKLDGWIVWFDEQNVPGLNVKEWGPRFVSLEQWQTILSKIRT